MLDLVFLIQFPFWKLRDWLPLFKLGKLVVLTILTCFGHINMSDIKFKIVSALLCFLINLSTSTGIVPDKIKIARVVPVYKSDNPSLFCNCRPISILPCFSNFFLKCSL